MLLRFCMQVVQLFVKCLPLRFKRYLREQPRLAYLYTAWLCKTKLHPSVNGKIAIGNSRHQTVEKGDALYAACMAHHNTLLSTAQSEQKTVREVTSCAIIFHENNFLDFESQDAPADKLKAQEYERSLLRDTIESINACIEAPRNIFILCSNKNLQKLAKPLLKGLNNVKLLNAQQIQHAVSEISSTLFIVQHGDLLHSHCFAALSRATCNGDYIYVDTDKIEQGERYDPAFFPDWNPDFQLSTGYIQSGLLLNKAQTQIQALVEENLLIDKMLERLYLQDVSVEVGHIPFVLVHSQKLEANERKPVDTSKHFSLERAPLVSLIIPTYNGVDILRPCVESILEKTTYSNYEICIVNNRSDDADTLDFLDEVAEHELVSVLDYPYPFNYSAINNYAAEHVSGEVIGLINNDVEVISPEWLSVMVAHVQRPDVGCVGAKLLYSNELVQHAGVVMGYGGGAGHANKYLPAYRPGYLQRAIATQNYSAVTAACLLVTRDDFDKAGRLNEVDLTVAFNDVDFCLNVLELGRRNVLAAEALLFHHESISRGHEDTLEKQKRFQGEVRYMQEKWAKFIQHDPAYNPNLTLSYENFSIRQNLEKIPL